MKIENYIEALEQLKTMHEELGCGISQVLGALKGELFKAKKMPARLRMKHAGLLQ